MRTGGYFRFRTLGLGRFVDAWYRQFTYEVMLPATQDDSFTSGTWPTQFDLQDESGNDLNPPPAGNGVVVIMSYGANGSGSFTTDGTQMPGPPVTAVTELANLDNDFVFSSATYSSDTANPFDDLVLILTEEQIVEPLAKRGVLKNYGCGINFRTSQRDAILVLPIYCFAAANPCLLICNLPAPTWTACRPPNHRPTRPTKQLPVANPRWISYS